MALRYAALLRHAPEVLTAQKLLEVGAGHTGLRDVAPRELTEVDLAFPNGPPPPGVNRVVSSALALPLADDEFDAVVCMDMLEHLPPAQREPALAEMARVLRPGGFLAVACPTGPAAARADARLDRSLRRRHGHGEPGLSEHLANGLPRREEVEQAIGAAVPQATVRVHPHLNVVASYLVHMYRTGRGYRVVRRLGAYRPRATRMFFRMLSRLNVGPTYRTIFVARAPGRRS